MAVVLLKNCIRCWELSLFHDKFLMDPATQVIVESTISYLKELETIKGLDPTQGTLPE